MANLESVQANGCEFTFVLWPCAKSISPTAQSFSLLFPWLCKGMRSVLRSQNQSGLTARLRQAWTALAAGREAFCLAWPLLARALSYMPCCYGPVPGCLWLEQGKLCSQDHNLCSLLAQWPTRCRPQPDCDSRHGPRDCPNISYGPQFTGLPALIGS